MLCCMEDFKWPFFVNSRLYGAIRSYDSILGHLQSTFKPSFVFHHENRVTAYFQSLSSSYELVDKTVILHAERRDIRSLCICWSGFQ
jgi:hypothetical protein